jgi:hypothetical protein
MLEGLRQYIKCTNLYSTVPPFTLLALPCCWRLPELVHSQINERQARSYLKLSSPNYTAAADAPAGSSSSSSSSKAHTRKAKSSSSSSSSSLVLQRLPPAKGFLEAFYAFWYKGRPDSWRLLRSLATRLDGR